VNNTHAEIPSLSRGFVGSDLENMFGKDAQCASDKTCVQPKKVSFFPPLLQPHKLTARFSLWFLQF
jgi:hypothetical protein